RLHPMPLIVAEGPVTHVSVGPEGQVAAGYSRSDTPSRGGGGVLFDAGGHRLHSGPNLTTGGRLLSVAIRPECGSAVGQWRRLSKDLRVVLFGARGNRLRSEPLAIDGLVSSMVFGPAGQFAVAYSQGSMGARPTDHGVAVFDAWGHRDRFVPFHRR